MTQGSKGKRDPFDQALMNLYTELVDENFPKHQCKERGQAIVLVAELNCNLRALIQEYLLDLIEVDSPEEGRKGKLITLGGQLYLIRMKE